MLDHVTLLVFVPLLRAKTKRGGGRSERKPSGGGGAPRNRTIDYADRGDHPERFERKPKQRKGGIAKSRRHTRSDKREFRNSIQAPAALSENGALRLE